MKIRGVCFSLFTVLVTVIWVTPAKAQGTIKFDAFNNWIGTNYTESCTQLRLIVPTGSSFDYMGILYGYGNTPHNGTPYMQWFRQNNPYNYVVLSLTNGLPFGLVEVDLADPIAPSYTNLPISFIGYRLDGSTVTNTFVTPGGGANYFVTYQFSSEFASGLLSVQIDAARWAMDNLVWVPEPRTYALVGLGLLAVAWHRFHKRRKL